MKKNKTNKNDANKNEKIKKNLNGRLNYKAFKKLYIAFIFSISVNIQNYLFTNITIFLYHEKLEIEIIILYYFTIVSNYTTGQLRRGIGLQGKLHRWRGNVSIV